MMSLILIQTVGTGGEKNPVWEALARTILERSPSMVIWLGSQKTISDTVPKIKQILDKQRGPQERPFDTREVISDDVEDVDALARQYASIIDSVRAEFPGVRLEADFTSGTKPMSAALVASSVSRRISRLNYASGPRDDSGRAMRTEKIVSLSTDCLIADRLLNELGRLFDLGQHLAVYEQAKELCQWLEDKTLLAKARSLTFVAKAYEQWNRFDWSGAFSDLRQYKKQEVEQALKSAGWDVEALGQQAPYLKRCKNNHLSAQRLNDLLENARRCINRGRNDDAVARLYRLIEYIGQIRLTGLGIVDEGHTNKTPMDKLRKKAPIYTTKSLQSKPQSNGTCKLGLRDNLEVLAEAGDSVGVAIMVRYNAKGADSLKNMLNTRNQSLLAHGTQPVDPKSAKGLLITADAIFEEHMQSPADGSDAKENLAALRSTGAFLKCPWV